MPRNQSLVDADKKQHPDIFQPGPLIVADQNLIRRRRDHRHLRLLEPGLQDLLVIRKRDRLVPEYFHQLIQQFHNDPVDLRIFPGHSSLTLLLEHIFLPLQFSLAIAFHDKVIEGFRLKEDRRLPLLHSFRKRLHFLQKTPPEFIDMQQFLRLHAAVTPGPCLPVPLKSPDSQRNHIIFQFIGLLPGKASHPAPQVAEHRFIGKVLNDQIQRRPEKLHKRIHQYRMFFVDKTRDPRLPENLPGIAGIRREISGNHSNFPVAVFPGADQLMDLRSHRTQLFLRVDHHADREFPVRHTIPLRSVITIQILFQEIQRASLAETAVYSPLRPDLR